MENGTDEGLPALPVVESDEDTLIAFKRVLTHGH
jgi:hypothetical protein